VITQVRVEDSHLALLCAGYNVITPFRRITVDEWNAVLEVNWLPGSPRPLRMGGQRSAGCV